MGMCTKHYLKDSPVFDLSMKVAGPIALQGHYFCNQMWRFIKKHSRTGCLPESSRVIPGAIRIRVGLQSCPKEKMSIPMYKAPIVDPLKMRGFHLPSIATK